MTIKEIESAVSHLSQEELDQFSVWFDKFEAESWDAQLEKDVQSGKLDKLADQAIKDSQAGRCIEL